MAKKPRKVKLNVINPDGTKNSVMLVRGHTLELHGPFEFNTNNRVKVRGEYIVVIEMAC